MVGKRILHYQLIDKIGAGGMGEIYKAEDTRLNRPVAVKILSPSMSTDAERRRRFFQEAQAASALNHPNIITLYDIVAEGETQCIVMEYIGGKTLRDLIPASGLPPAQTVQYAAQIASALAAAHSARIIHRDLKPSNIMVNSSGLIKVLDFGLAKWVDSGLTGPGEQSTAEAALTREGSIIGTVSYMSPEQAEGKRVDARSDIFSFGSVVYEMLTGKRAFEGRSGISTLSSILRDDVRPMAEAAPKVPPLLEQIVLRCLPKEPAARWQSMKEIETALLTLQRQLDPDGQFAPPITSVAIPSLASTLEVPANAPPVPAPPPPVVASVATEPEPVVAAPPPPAAPPTLNGPSRSVPPPAIASNGDVHEPPAVPVQTPLPLPRPSSAPSSKLWIGIVAVLVVLLAAAGIGGWYWMQSRRAPASSVASVNPPAQTAPAPAPTPEPPAATPPVAPSTDASKATVKKTPKPKAKPAKILPPPPVAAPAPPPPTTVTAPPPALPSPAPPKPEIQTTPVLVGDALPFAIHLNEDVPADATDGQTLHFTVTEGLQVNGKVVIAKGATVSGEVTGESGKKFLGLGGHKLTFRLTQAEAVDGRKIAVRALAGKNDDGATIRSFETGKGSKPKGYAAVQGTTYIAYIDGDQMVAVRK